ncbi:MAG: NAD(P)/FAD-dependent oxidoreductase [Bacteroidales bacterium]|nr:NAD(P)/FAD-dependent oxidoreductase [Bacteroidales bacterium]
MTIIVGAGAAGMMAALVAAEQGQQVLLIEKMDQPGRKLRITGKGRCNLTNTAPLKEFLDHCGSDSRFLRNSLSRYYNTELMAFFESHGVPLVVERGNRVYPQSGKSLDIFLALIQTIERNPNIQVLKHTAVRELIIEEGRVLGVTLADGTSKGATKVILATGGQSYPLTGSTGDGYALARQAGHTIVPPVPSLVPLTTQEPIPDDLVGFVLKNVALRVGKQEYFGEMTFCEDGIAGPIALTLSREVCRRLPLEVSLDLKPALDSATLDKRLIKDLDTNGSRLFHDALRLWMPAELIPLCLQRTKIEKFKRLNQVNGQERKRLLQFLKGIPFTLTGTHGWEEAIVTQGGVSLKEVNPKTMESRLLPGLFFAGELLDLDADTGGYNLQIAFSTAVAAARG